ncbi:MAG: rod shape-determining protein RodA [Paludibacteraceae bacterium]|nr:rod shape-determining protein RodA [Paludibacteraceae bacterium]
MPSRKTRLYKSIDWPTVICYLLLLIVGVLNIYSADYNPDVVSKGLNRADSQLIWIGISVSLSFVILAIDHRMYHFFSYFIYGALILLLIATIFLSASVKGSHSWLYIGGIRLFQPAEFAKFATALAVARLMSSFDFELKKTRCLVQVLVIMLLPVFIIILQRETGSALVFFSLFLVLYREGMSGLVMLLGLLFVLLFVLVLRFSPFQMAGELGSWGLFSALMLVMLIGIIVLIINGWRKLIFRYVLSSLAIIFLLVFVLNKWTSLDIKYTNVALAISVLSGLCCLLYGFLRQHRIMVIVALFLWGMSAYCYSVNYIFDNVLEYHQQTRIKVLLGLEDDPTGVGYNINQSKIAIGSGGFVGKGFLEGTQTKLEYVPEQVTDFIFCNIGEEFGFLGSVFVLLLYMYFLFRLVKLAERQESPFNRIYGYSVVSIFLFHVLVNVGMVVGLMPVIGIPLPFVSYGGSSLLAFTILLFIFIKLDASRS